MGAPDTAERGVMDARAALETLRKFLRYVDAPHGHRLSYGEAVEVVARELERLQREVGEWVEHEAQYTAERDAAVAERDDERTGRRMAEDERERLYERLQALERPFDKSEYDAMYERMTRAESDCTRLSDHASRLLTENAELRAYCESQDWHTEWYAPLKAKVDAAVAELESSRFAHLTHAAALEGECERLREALRQIAALDREIDTAKQIARAALAGSECDGSSDCKAERHIHGCFADEGDCDRPSEHAAGREQTGQAT